MLRRASEKGRGSKNITRRRNFFFGRANMTTAGCPDMLSQHFLIAWSPNIFVDQ
jgi:hypothetical protein